jgi:hypothetical protein
MHLITQRVHLLPFSNSAMKDNNGTNRTLYHDIAAQTTTEPAAFHCWKQVFWIVGFLGCSPNVNSSWCRDKSERQLVWSYHACVSSCLMSRFYGRVTIVYASELTFSNQRFAKLQPRRGCWIREAHVGQFLWKQGSQDEYSVLLSSVLQELCDFSKQSFSMYDNLFLSMLIFAHFFSSTMLPSHDLCMPK